VIPGTTGTVSYSLFVLVRTVLYSTVQYRLFSKYAELIEIWPPNNQAQPGKADEPVPGDATVLLYDPISKF
jgi:hypothetical protein